MAKDLREHILKLEYTKIAERSIQLREHLGPSLGGIQGTHTIVMERLQLFSKLISTNTEVKSEETDPQDTTAWSYDMDCHFLKCVEGYRELAHKTVDCIVTIVFGKNRKTIFYFGQFLAWPDQSQKWKPACDVRLARLISSSHNQLQTLWWRFVIQATDYKMRYSKTQILQEIWRTQSQSQVGLCVSSDRTYFC